VLDKTRRCTHRVASQRVPHLEASAPACLGGGVHQNVTRGSSSRTSVSTTQAARRIAARVWSRACEVVASQETKGLDHWALRVAISPAVTMRCRPPSGL
jgi:hypothetical protein